MSPPEQSHSNNQQSISISRSLVLAAQRTPDAELEIDEILILDELASMLHDQRTHKALHLMVSIRSTLIVCRSMVARYD